MWVNYEVKLPFAEKLPKQFVMLLKEEEDADKAEDLALYINLLDAIDNGAKTLNTNGVISQHEWGTIMNRYMGTNYANN